MRFYLFLLFIVTLMSSCIKYPEYPDIPAIKAPIISKSLVQETIPTMVNNEWVQNADSVDLSFEFTDGDGDLGLQDGNTAQNVYFIDSVDLCLTKDSSQYKINANVFVKDMRTGCVRIYNMPYLTPEGSVKTISGRISILLNTFICRKNIVRDYDTVFYEMQIVDREGRMSNTIQTDDLIIDCL